MGDANQLAQLKMSTTTTLKASDIRIHDFQIDGKSTPILGDDLLERISQAARQATQTRPPSALKLGAIDVDFEGLRVDLGDEGPEGRPLREAKKLIHEQQFEPAIVKLAEVLAIQSPHYEASYLTAYCHFKKERLKSALENLLPLKEAPLSNRMQTRVRSLKEDIRQQTIPKAAGYYANAVKTKQVDKLAEKMRQFAETDPEVGKFHYFLAGVLVVGKQFLEAREAARRGLQVCITDRDELTEFLREIDQRFVPEALGPARDRYREKKYAAARKALEATPAEVQQATLYKTFQNQLDQLLGKAKPESSGGLLARFLPGKVVSVQATKSSKDLNEFFEFVVAREMTAARTAVTEKDIGKAERALKAALVICPAFAQANHMLATCVYQRESVTVREKIGLDLDESSAKQLRKCQHELAEARQYAVIGSQDPDIPDGPLVLASIDEMRQQIDEVVTKFEVQIHDAKIVNQTIDDFFTVLLGMIKLQQLTASDSPWVIRSTAEDLYGNLKRMSDSLPGLRRQCKGEHAREIVDIVRNNFVEPQFTALRRLMGR
ncbi:MAG: hypothetical protein ACKV2Q_05525 [Planctomycetaceae bacterium]